MKRAIIFDFGGVLMKTADPSPRHAWDKRLSMPPGSVESIVHGSAIWHKAQTGLISVEAYWREVARALHVTNSEIEQLARDYFSGDRLDEALIEYIRGLRKAGHVVGLLSNDSIELRDKLRTLGIAGLFDPLVISAEIGVMKPGAAAYEAVLKHLGRAPSQVVFVDDREENVAAARALGICGVLYSAGMDLPAALAPVLVE